MQINGLDDKFTSELEIPPEFDSLVRKYLTIDPIKAFLNDPSDKLIYGVKFHPLKPFKTSVDINILR